MFYEVILKVIQSLITIFLDKKINDILRFALSHLLYQLGVIDEPLDVSFLVN